MFEKRLKIFVLLSAVVFGTVAGEQTAYAEPKDNLKDAEIQAHRHRDLALFRVQMFHHQAKSSLVTSLELPVFTDYFKLPESKNNLYDNVGQIQLTNRQNDLRKRMEEWVMALHSRFEIGESCLTDRHGQEHMRVVAGKVERPVDFSSEEASAPFFRPSFSMKKGSVYISAPYMSPDTFHWVVAFTSPIKADDGTKPAFLHIEVPLEIYHQIVSTKNFGFAGQGDKTLDLKEEGRFFIVDTDGFLIADSRGLIDFELKRERHPLHNDNLPDYVPEEKFSDYAPKVESISNDKGFLAGVKKMQSGETGQEVFEIDGRNYVLAFSPIKGRPWSLGHLDPIGGPGFWQE